jgi:hypothetical protein
MPDPKDRLPEYRLYEAAQALLCTTDGWKRLPPLSARFWRATQRTRWRAAIWAGLMWNRSYTARRASVSNKVVTAAPDDYMAQFELGIADKKLGLTHDALEHLQAACKLAPGAEQCRKEMEGLEK